ncbi:hypothetical protein [Persicitalea jodogahamensis]|nr:hypothetical protein [Persicitalea jodogahamensis]
MNSLKSVLTSGRFWLIACLTMGLAPFRPEPHILGKLRWVLGGAAGMKLVDWGDFLLHGLPWVGLLGYGIWYLKRNKKA